MAEISVELWRNVGIRVGWFKHGRRTLCAFEQKQQLNCWNFHPQKISSWFVTPWSEQYRHQNHPVIFSAIATRRKVGGLFAGKHEVGMGFVNKLPMRRESDQAGSVFLRYSKNLFKILLYTWYHLNYHVSLGITAIRRLFHKTSFRFHSFTINLPKWQLNF